MTLFAIDWHSLWDLLRAAASLALSSMTVSVVALSLYSGLAFLENCLPSGQM